MPVDVGLGREGQQVSRQPRAKLVRSIQLDFVAALRDEGLEAQAGQRSSGKRGNAVFDLAEGATGDAGCLLGRVHTGSDTPFSRMREPSFPIGAMTCGGRTGCAVPPRRVDNFILMHGGTPPTGAPTDVVRPEAQGPGTAALSALGPSSAQAASMDPVESRGRFISTIQQGGLTNPYGLGAVAAYGQHESRYNPSNIMGSWSDPSESGQAGTSGGILSWRADRLANMRSFTQGASDPVVAQAKFFLQENPQLTRALQNAGSSEEANRLMADAWKFAGYNRPGGENAARLATTQAYANSFGGGGGGGGTLPALAASRGGSMDSTAQRGGFGLNGIVGQDAAVPGQASPVPGVASLSAQPTALAPDPVGFSSDPAAQLQQPSNQYAQIGNALKAAVGGQQKQGQKGGGMPFGQPGRPSPIGLQAAKAMFDPDRFYGMLRDAGVGRTV